MCRQCSRGEGTSEHKDKSLPSLPAVEEPDVLINKSVQSTAALKYFCVYAKYYENSSGTLFQFSNPNTNTCNSHLEKYSLQTLGSRFVCVVLTAILRGASALISVEQISKQVFDQVTCPRMQEVIEVGQEPTSGEVNSVTQRLSQHNLPMTLPLLSLCKDPGSNFSM